MQSFISSKSSDSFRASLKSFHDSNTHQHRVFPWVRTRLGEEELDIADEDVVDQHTVPVIVLKAHLNSEMNNEKAIKGLPWGILLVITFTLCLINHLQIQVVRDQENAITADLTENAVFAYVDPGAMAHKNLHDAHSFADVHTWLQIGFFPLLFKDTQPWSEGASFENHTITLGPKDRLSYLQHQRLIGGVRLAQTRTQSDTCINKEVAESLEISCLEVQPNLYLEPETEDVLMNKQFVSYDPKLTRWLLFLDERPALLELLQQLEASNWIDRSTSEVAVSFMSYSAQYDLLTMTDVFFFFSQSGHIWKHISNRSLILKHYKDAGSAVFDAIYVLLVLSYSITELREIRSHLRKASKKGQTMQDALGRYFRDPRNLVDWISIVFAAAMIAMWITTCRFTSDIVDELVNLGAAESNMIGKNVFDKRNAGLQGITEDVFSVFQLADGYFYWCQILACVYPMVIILRLFKAFAAQPSLAIVTRTLSRSANDVMHFSVVFLAIFVSFAVMGMGLFGLEIEEFSSLGRSITTCFVMMMGDFDVEPLWHTGRTVAVLWFISFQCLTVLIMMNMLLAIIMDTYEEVKNSVFNKETLLEHVKKSIRRKRNLRKGHRIPLIQIKEGLNKAFPESMNKNSTLDRFSTKTTRDSPMWLQVEVVTVQAFVEVVSGLGEEQAKRLMVGAVCSWRGACAEPVTLSETLHKVSQVHCRLERFIRQVHSTPSAMTPGQNSDDDLSKKSSSCTVDDEQQRHAPLSEHHVDISGSSRVAVPLPSSLESHVASQESHLNFLATEVTDIKQHLSHLTTEVLPSIQAKQEQTMRLLTYLTRDSPSNCLTSVVPFLGKNNSNVASHDHADNRFTSPPVMRLPSPSHGSPGDVATIADMAIQMQRLEKNIESIAQAMQVHSSSSIHEKSQGA